MPGHGGLTTFANQEIGAGEEAIIEVEWTRSLTARKAQVRPKKRSTLKRMILKKSN